MESIKTTFDTYDANGDGVISKTELEDLIRRRTQERIEVIEGRFEELINDPEMTEEDIVRAEEVKQQHLQHVQVAIRCVLISINLCILTGCISE